MNAGRSRGGCLSGLVLVVLLLAVGGLGFVYSGVYDVAASRPHTRAERWFLRTVMERSVRAHVEEVPDPPAENDELLATGFHHYDEMCVVCHGAPGVERSEIGEGIEPEPPDLADVADDWALPEIFWITSHGIKMAGMPAFGPTHSEDEIWGISMFTKRLPQIDAAGYARLRREAAEREAPPAGQGSPGAEPPHSHTH